MWPKVFLLEYRISVNFYIYSVIIPDPTDMQRNEKNIIQ